MFLHSTLSSIRSYLSREQGRVDKQRRAQKSQQRRKKAKGEARAGPDKQTRQQPKKQEGGAGAEKDRGGEDCTNHIRIAIVHWRWCPGRSPTGAPDLNLR